jgi:sigma-E factor negative regulatory protein RseC
VVEATDHELVVEVPARAPICGSCKTADACQEGLLGLSAGPRRYRLKNQIGARVGDRVDLTVAEGALWRAALASYGMPVLLAMGGAAVGQSLAADSGAVSGMLTGLGAGLFLLRRKEFRARRDAGMFSLHVQTREVRFKEKS